MAKIKLVNVGFSLIPEDDYVFKVADAQYDDTFGKIEVSLVTKEGRTHTERYSLIRDNGKLNEGAQKAFSYFAKTALNNFDVEEIEVEDLIGTYVSATVEHVESTTISEKTGEPFVNVRLNDLKSEISFGMVEVEEEEETVAESNYTQAELVNNTIAEIKSYLDDEGIAYISNDKKDVLISKLIGSDAEEDAEVDIDDFLA